MLKVSKNLDKNTRSSDDLFAEAVTGWATNRVFPMPNIPNRYQRLPWRRISRAYGVIRGALFIARILVIWPFELIIELAWPDRKSDQKPQSRHCTSQFSQGEHICFLYRNEQALQDTLTRYVAEGLAEGEQCFCIETKRMQERLCVGLRAIGVDSEKEIAKGSLVFLLEDDVYFGGGNFDPSALVDQLGKLIDQSLDAGFSGFRVSGEISRASGDPALQRQVIEYEKQVDEYFIDKKAIGFCHYHADKFSQEVLESVIDAHGLHMIEAYSSRA
jgi:MEDS: MEthanogen/methylotroph, DcmR Sensory domain